MPIIRSLSARVSLLAAASAVSVVFAQPASQPAPTVEALLREAIAAAPGQTMNVTKLTVAPGYVTAAHSHPGETFVYVLEGKILNQIGDEEPQIYEAGDFFFEHANAHHAQFVNLDKEKPATVLLFGIRPAEGN